MSDAQMIGPYRLERVLGTGSFATVWLARDDVLDRNVAVKVLADNWSRDDEVRRRFLSEARVLLTVESPRIVRGFHLGEAATGQPYLVMAWADRGTLGDRIDQRRREGRTFDANEVVGLGTEVAYALTDVHGSGHLHRDVKPTNVLIRSSSTRRSTPGLAADETIVLGDFGLARGLDLSALTLVAGSPGYVAPEQAAGLTQLDRRADLYSLGRIMLELLTGDPGGRATTMAGAASERIDVPKLLAVLHDKGGSAPSPQLVSLITRLVDENPDARPSSADEVAAELNAIARSFGPQGGGGRPLAPPSAPPLAAVGPDGARPLTGTQLSAPAPRGRPFSLTDRRVLGAAAVTLVAIAAVVAALAFGGGEGGGDDTTTTLSTTNDVTTVAVFIATVDNPSSTEIGVPVTADAGSTLPDSTATPSTGGTSTELGRGQLAGQMVMPDFVFVEGFVEGARGDLDPDRQSGTTTMTPDEFAAGLVAANSDWTGDPPAADADGNVAFTMSGPSSETANVEVSLQPNTAIESGVFTRYVIDYD